MPLFFFISGFFAFKPFSWFVGKKWTKKLSSKAVILLIPALIFVGLYPYLSFHFAKGESYSQMLSTGYFGGLWFLISLFSMIAIYYVGSAFARKFDIHFTKSNTAVIMAVVALVGACSLLIYTRIGGFQWIYSVLCIGQTLEKFQFFFFGIICVRWRDIFEKVLNNEIIRAIVIIVMIASAYESFNWGSSINSLTDPLKTIASIAVRYIYRYTALWVTVMFFHDYFGNMESQQNKIGLSLSYVGRHTLSIYLLHYLFLVPQKGLGMWLKNNDYIMSDAIVAGIITIIILTLCLLVARIVKCSKILNKCLFANQ
jgi:fucose 4-O-acetylase-like acetyltransferase